MTDRLSGGAARLERIVDSDANGMVNRTLRVAESDITNLLGAYMSIKSLDMRTKKTENGYCLEIRVDVERFYDIGNVSDT